MFRETFSCSVHIFNFRGLKDGRDCRFYLGLSIIEIYFHLSSCQMEIYGKMLCYLRAWVPSSEPAKRLLRGALALVQGNDAGYDDGCENKSLPPHRLCSTARTAAATALQTGKLSQGRRLCIADPRQKHAKYGLTHSTSAGRSEQAEFLQKSQDFPLAGWVNSYMLIVRL
jgi:hypothetical protein